MLVTGLPVLDPPAHVQAPRQYADVLVPEALADLPEGGSLGSPSAASDGDLAGATPTQALRTRVIRLLSNVEDAYAHLAGWGAAARRGQLARQTDLDRMQLQAERRLLEDPDVTAATVSITSAPNGVRRAFLFDVAITDRLGRADRFLTSGE